MTKRIINLLGAIIIGLMASVWIIQNNTQLEVALSQRLISKLENMWGIKISHESSRINFFTCSLFLKKGQITDPRKSNCHWKFEQCKIHIYPIALILKKKININLTFNDVVATTQFNDGKLDIADHISAMFAKGVDGIEANPRCIQVNNLDVEIYNKTNKIHLLATGNFKAKKLGTHNHQDYGWHCQLAISDSQISLNDKIIAQSALAHGDLYKSRISSEWNAKLSAHIKHFPSTPKQSYFIEGQWNKDLRQLLATSHDKSLKLKIDFVPDIIKINGNFDLDHFVNTFNYLYKPKNEFVFESNISGKCRFDGDFIFNRLAFRPKSKVIISDLSYKMFMCREIGLELIKSDDKSMLSNIKVELLPGIVFDGLCSWDFKNNVGHGKLINNSLIKPLKNKYLNLGFGDYVINSKNLGISANLNTKVEINGAYKFKVHNQKTDQSMTFVGAYEFKEGELKIKGSDQKRSLTADLQMQPRMHFSKLKYKLGNNTVLDFRTKNKEDLILRGDFSYSFVKDLLNPSTKNLLLGHDCVFNLQINQEKLSKIQGSLSLKNGSFYIPESQNLIKNFNSEYEFVFPRKVYLNNVKIGFFKGEVSSPRVSIIFDKGMKIAFLHLPIQVNDLLINYKKDLLGIIYGNVLIKKELDSGYKALGQVVLKKSLLRENIFAATDKYNFYSGWNSVLPSDKDFEFDFKIITEQPIKAKTPTLETSAVLNLSITHKSGNSIINIPQLTGTVKLDGGFIRVLQNKLMIEYGKIEFVANQMNDPIIDLIAKNRINKYMVTLQASGSLQKPTILVESTPELTEEQVLSLLLSGYESYKLQTDLLAMVEQNLYNVILGSKNTQPESNNLLQKITRPLKYIQISPDFTDQSARGGIKGTININVNDQVKAQIQKNFNLQEDFSAQLEYMLSDDVNVKAIKDQRGELGAEVELRLKF